MAVQNSAIRTNHIKARIGKTQQNSKCRLCDDRDETINHIISECSKLAQKDYKARHDWVGKVIHWEMYKKFKFDHTNKWYMHNPAPVLENDTDKLPWDIKTNHLISARRPDLIIIIFIKSCRVSRTLSRHFSLSFIASGRSSGLHPASSHSCYMYVRTGRPAFARPYVGIHSSTLLLQQCPACLVRLTWMVFVMGGRWPYRGCLVGCCRQDFFFIYFLV